jgi:peroxiredoxin
VFKIPTISTQEFTMPSKRQLAREKAKTKQSNQNIIMLVVGVGLILLAAAGFLSIPKAAKSLQEQELSAIPSSVHFTAPEVQLTNLDGNPVAISDYAGQVILYNAWATWCPPCKAEMPTLLAFYEKYKDQGFVIIAIEDGQPVAEVAAFVKEYGLTFPVWPDPKYRASTAFQANGLPTSYVIDRDGTVRLTWSGAITLAKLEEYVAPLITAGR